jgi:broad specificity phosphatase PhoE
MRRIWLTRHGETEWNAGGKLQGHTDIPLNEMGRQQARALAARFASLELVSVWSSDLGRARETGAIIAAALKLAEPGVDLELRERCFGVFEGLTRDECQARHPEEWKAWQTSAASPPGGEEMELVPLRMERALERIWATSDHGASLVVSHGGAMRLWLRTVVAEPIPLIKNGATYLVERAPSGKGFTARLVDEDSPAGVAVAEVAAALSPEASLIPGPLR